MIAFAKGENQRDTRVLNEFQLLLQRKCATTRFSAATTGTGVLPVPVAIERMNNYAIFEQDSALGALGDIGVVSNHQDGRS